MDPYSLMHRTIFDRVSGSLAVRGAIKNFEKNVVGYIDKRLPALDNVVASDLPELQMSPRSLTPQFYFASDTVEVVQGYNFFLSTGDRRVDEHLLPVQWAICCAIGDMLFSNILDNVLWNNKRFIQDVAPAEASAGLSDPTLNRGIAGWSLVYPFTVTMHFARVDLIAFNRGEIE